MSAPSQQSQLHASATELMRRINSRDGYEPVPFSQIRSQMDEGESEIGRLRGWLQSKTVRKGHFSDYAVEVNSDGEKRELHLSNAAKDLGMDEANARDAWRRGVQRGLWRNGTKAEGERRLYIRGDVPKLVQPKGEEKGKEKVCADLLPPYILKQIKDWPSEKRLRLLAEEQADKDIDDQLRADFDAARRALMALRQDTRFQSYGIKKIRERHEFKNGHAAEYAARQERVQHLLPVLEPVVKRSAQTFEEFAQTHYEALRKAQNGVRADPPTLLPETLRQKLDSQASGNSDAVSEPAEPLPFEGEKSPNQLPAPLKPREARSPRDPHQETPEQRNERRTKLPELETQEEREAENILFSEISRMRQMYPATDFGAAEFSQERECDRIIARRILRTVGAENLTQFIISVIANFKGIDRNSLGKQEPRAPGMTRGPRGIGLIVTWADDFGRRLADAAKPAPPAPEIRRREIQACTEILRITRVRGVAGSYDAALRDYSIELLRLYGVNLGPKEGGRE